MIVRGASVINWESDLSFRKQAKLIKVAKRGRYRRDECFLRVLDHCFGFFVESIDVIL